MKRYLQKLFIVLFSLNTLKLIYLAETNRFLKFIHIKTALKKWANLKNYIILIKLISKAC